MQKYHKGASVLHLETSIALCLGCLGQEQVRTGSLIFQHTLSRRRSYPMNFPLKHDKEEWSLFLGITNVMMPFFEDELE